MDITYEKKNVAGLIRATGRLDASTAEQFEQSCSVYVNVDSASNVIDFSKIEYVSSAGLRSVLMLVKKSKMNKGTVVFCNLSSMAYEVFKISGFLSVLNICGTIEDAMLFLEN